MTQDRVVLEKCCFCFPKRYGLLTYGYIILIFHLLRLAGFIAEFSLDPRFTWIVFDLTYLILNILNIVFISFLIYGGHKKTPKWLKIFFWYQITAICMSFLLDLMFFYTIGALSAHPIHITLCLLVMYGVLSPFIIYLLIIVRSNYLKMQRNYPVAYTAQVDL